MRLLRKHAHTSKDRQRFYLLPGMGGSALKRKRQLFMRWSLATGVAVSLLVAVLLYYLSRQ